MLRALGIEHCRGTLANACDDCKDTARMVYALARPTQFVAGNSTDRWETKAERATRKARVFAASKARVDAHLAAAKAVNDIPPAPLVTSVFNPPAPISPTDIPPAPIPPIDIPPAPLVADILRRNDAS